MGTGNNISDSTLDQERSTSPTHLILGDRCLRWLTCLPCTHDLTQVLSAHRIKCDYVPTTGSNRLFTAANGECSRALLHLRDMHGQTCISTVTSQVDEAPLVTTPLHTVERGRLLRYAWFYFIHGLKSLFPNHLSLVRQRAEIIAQIITESFVPLLD